jgi:AraC family transcriptional regulator
MLDSNEGFAQPHLPRVTRFSSENEPLCALPNTDIILLRARDLLRGARDRVCGEREKKIKNPDSYYRAAVRLQSGNVELSCNDRTFFSGLAQPGMFFLTEPNATLRARFSVPASNGLHVLFSERYVNELRCESGRNILRPAKVQYDAELVRLCSALTDDTSLRSTTDEDGLYLSGLAAAILGRLLHPSAEFDSSGSVGRDGLAKWRVRRVQQYVVEHLSQPISLADLADASGLSRMHFAIQFKEATGLRPHEFVLAQRIKRAKRILCSTGLPLIQVAFDVGFETHSHFSAMFKRCVGMSPTTWRALHK